MGTVAQESNMRTFFNILYQKDFEVLTSGRFIQDSVLHVACKQLKRVNSFDIFNAEKKKVYFTVLLHIAL